MASTYLQKNTATATDAQKFTYSGWLKRGAGIDNAGYGDRFYIGYLDGNNRFYITFAGGDTIFMYAKTGGTEQLNWETTRKFRDPSAWYHIVVSADSTQGTQDDRLKLYVNGVQETSFIKGTSPGQSFSWGNQLAQSNNTLRISGDENANNLYDGSMSHIHFIDGTAYDASAFGQYDANGVWTIKTSPSVTYGTNGFFILKDGNSVTDQSGEGNNFTVGGGNLTNTEDNPSNVFATWNGIAANLDTTLTNGNTKVAHGSQLERRPVISALGMSSGKYYAEFKALSGTGSNIEVGIVNRSDPTTQGRYMGQSLQDAGFIAYKFNGDINFDGTNTTGFTTTATNDILGVAVDIDNTRVYFYKNGTLINSGGTSFANMSGGDGDYFFCNGDRSGTSTYSLEANFGNGYFGTTAVSSAGTNASNNGIFEYDVPTGYTALSTKGLNL